VKDKHLTCVLSMDREILYRCKISKGKWWKFILFKSSNEICI